MTELFKRVAAVTVGKAAAGQQTTTGLRYAGLRISFQIEKNCEGTANPGKVTIYNLSAASRAQIEPHKAVMILEAGYLGLDETSPLTGILYSGYVRRVTSARNGPDITTELEAGDGEVPLTEQHVDQTFAAGTSWQQVVKTLSSTLGLAVGYVTTTVQDVFQHGLSLSGLVSTHLDALTAKHDLEWHVQDGALYVLPKDSGTAEQAVVLTKDTGLVGIPAKRDFNIEFTCLLNPLLRPGRYVQLTSDTISGQFRIRRVTHQGDTHGGDWLSKVEAV